MPIELADITLPRVHRITTLERSAVATHSIPGLNGDLIQQLGRFGVRFRIDGAYHGQSGRDDLTALRAIQHAGKPVDFLADIVQHTYVGQVIVEELRVEQRADRYDEFGFSLLVVEYIEPPEPATVAIAPELQRKAKEFMALANLPVIDDPTPSLQRALRDLEAALQVLDSAVQPLRGFFGLLPEKSVDMQVLDTKGKPIDGITFLFIGPDGTQHRALSVAGRLQVETLPEGEYTIVPES